MESKLLIRHHVKQAGILFLRQVVIGFGTFVAFLAPKLIIYSFPVAVQQCLSVSNHSELSLQPRFTSARDQLRLSLSGMRWQHMQGCYFLLDASRIPGSWTLVTLQALLDEPRGLLKHVPGSGLNRCGTKICQTCEVLDGCHERSPCSGMR